MNLSAHHEITSLQSKTLGMDPSRAIPDVQIIFSFFFGRGSEE
jgi:hypothetical protein